MNEKFLESGTLDSITEQVKESSECGVNFDECIANNAVGSAEMECLKINSARALIFTKKQSICITSNSGNGNFDRKSSAKSAALFSSQSIT